jgi:phytoene dehydrogenase-like protein
MPSNAIAMALGIAAHAVGWPFPKGGAGAITGAMASYFRSLGGEIRTGAWVKSTAELPPSRTVLFDITPRQLLAIAGDKLPCRYQKALSRFRYGPGAFKLDYALSGPIPWESKACREAATVHLGGTIEEIAASEMCPPAGKIADKPYVLLAQCSLFDRTRAPQGKHTVWAYCHVPHGSTVDVRARLEAQIERFAPGFRELVLARTVTTPAGLEASNPNYVGGDIGGGSAEFRQLVFRPVIRGNPYAIPVKGWYLCSASTPPGAGVHGMCGHLAARSALSRDL